MASTQITLPAQTANLICIQMHTPAVQPRSKRHVLRIDFWRHYRTIMGVAVAFWIAWSALTAYVISQQWH